VNFVNAMTYWLTNVVVADSTLLSPTTVWPNIGEESVKAKSIRKTANAQYPILSSFHTSWATHAYVMLHY
jgi:hypothetical protein